MFLYPNFFSYIEFGISNGLVLVLAEENHLVRLVWLLLLVHAAR